MHLENLDAAKVVKTAPTSIEAVNLGYASEQRGYHVYIPSLARFTVAHPTKFVDEKYLDVPELTRAPSSSPHAQAKACTRHCPRDD